MAEISFLSLMFLINHQLPKYCTVGLTKYTCKFGGNSTPIVLVVLNSSILAANTKSVLSTGHELMICSANNGAGRLILLFIFAFTVSINVYYYKFCITK